MTPISTPLDYLKPCHNGQIYPRGIFTFGPENHWEVLKNSGTRTIRMYIIFPLKLFCNHTSDLTGVLYSAVSLKICKCNDPVITIPYRFLDRWPWEPLTKSTELGASKSVGTCFILPYGHFWKTSKHFWKSSLLFSFWAIVEHLWGVVAWVLGERRAPSWY